MSAATLAAPFAASLFRAALAVALAKAVRPLLAVAALLAALPAAAVILSVGDGTGNTTPPEDDFGFDHVGSAGETAVYLGNGWVITANHVGTRDVVLGGVPYPPVPGSRLRLRNPDARVSADLALFRLQEPHPPLPSLPIRPIPPEAGDPVVLMGNGPDRGEPFEHEGRPGWRWGDDRVLRWGTNRIHIASQPVQTNVGDWTQAFSTRLSPTDPTEFEAAVGVGDSGGAAFLHRDGRWELAGVLFAARTREGQPPRTTLYGNLAYAADLSVYRPQILAVIDVPSCANGLDDDGDDRVDHPDDDGCSDPDDPVELSAPPGLGEPAPQEEASGRLAWLTVAIVLAALLWWWLRRLRRSHAR